jgi:hypothetical protein
VRIASNLVKLSLGDSVTKDTVGGAFPTDPTNSATLAK